MRIRETVNVVLMDMVKIPLTKINNSDIIPDFYIMSKSVNQCFKFKYESIPEKYVSKNNILSFFLSCIINLF